MLSMPGPSMSSTPYFDSFGDELMGKSIFFPLKGKLASSCLQILLVFASWYLPSCRRAASRAERGHPLAVRVAQVRLGTVRDVVAYVGTVHSMVEIRVLARVAGRIAALPVPEGQSARRGTTIAVVAAPEIGARVGRLYAEVGRAREESAFLCRQARIDATLAEKGAIPKVKADQSRQRCISSRAALRAAKAALRETRAVRGRTVEQAPFDGVVLKWLAEPGENTMPGRPILLFGGKRKEVRVLVHEGDVERGIRPETPVDLQIGAGRRVRTSVTRVSPMASGPGRMFDVRVALPESVSRTLLHGTSVSLSFVLREEANAKAVPEGALVLHGRKSGVFAVRGGRARWIPVTPTITEGGWVAVRGELTAEDRVIVGNLDEVRADMPVYPVRSRAGRP